MSAAELVDLLTECSVAPRAAMPRDNGELVFNEPWESRAFAMAVALTEEGVFTWNDFQQSLITTVQAWERTHGPDDEYVYYERWMEALEALVENHELVDRATVDGLATEYAARPAGHDHRHDDHDHSHDHDHAHG